MKKERPMLFNGDMVRGILSDNKLQTRRVMKPQPEHCQYYEWNNKVLHDAEYRVWCWKQYVGDDNFMEIDYQLGHACPHGKPGDYLWVKETTVEDCRGSISLSKYAADGAPVLKGGVAGFYNTVANWNFAKPTRPSILMPRWASRLDLLIMKTRIEKLQDITEEDAIREGIELIDHNCFKNYLCDVKTDPHYGCHYLENPISSFRSLWVSINGQESWDENPYVWVIDFKRVDASENEFEGTGANAAAN